MAPFYQQEDNESGHLHFMSDIFVCFLHHVFKMFIKSNLGQSHAKAQNKQKQKQKTNKQKQKHPILQAQL